MRLLADLHIAPRTVEYLRSLGHDVVRVSQVLPPTSSDHEIIAYAARDRRAILTQDLDFSAEIAVSGFGTSRSFCCSVAPCIFSH
jgi:predicted nuclease of predicted toxin-antitoxin system